MIREANGATKDLTRAVERAQQVINDVWQEQAGIHGKVLVSAIQDFIMEAVNESIDDFKETLREAYKASSQHIAATLDVMFEILTSRALRIMAEEVLRGEREIGNAEAVRTMIGAMENERHLVMHRLESLLDGLEKINPLTTPIAANDVYVRAPAAALRIKMSRDDDGKMCC